MAVNYRLWEMAQVISLLSPAADAAGRTSAYVSLKNAQKAFIVCYITQGNAATIALTPLQASAVAGTGSKALTSAAPIAVNLDTDTIPSDTMSIVAAAANYTTDAGVKNKIVIFEIDPIESMDINNGFNHIAVSTGASNAANITSALLVITPLRYQQQVPPASAGI